MLVVRARPRPRRRAGRATARAHAAGCRMSLLSSGQVCAEHWCSRCKRYEMLTLATGWVPASRLPALFMLTPRMLLARMGRLAVVCCTNESTTTNAATRAASLPHRPHGSRATEESDALRKRRESANRFVRKGEVSRARHLLTGSAMAPGDARALSQRPDRPRVPIPPESARTPRIVFSHLFTTARKVLGPVPVLAAAYGSSGAGWEAAVGGCLQPACVSQELVQSGWVTSSTELCDTRKLEQRSGEGSLRGNGEDATPTVHPSGLSSAAHGDRCAGSAGLREKSEDLRPRLPHSSALQFQCRKRQGGSGEHGATPDRCAGACAAPRGPTQRPVAHRQRAAAGRRA